jgi:aryl-alcohol dehydrogenase-like predicted oxidoreductase
MGLADAIGVSNFNAQRVKATSLRLQQAGIPLASNQVQYSLLYRTPERNGVLEACREQGTTLVAYSPLCQGLLTGKYVEQGAKPFGPRKFLFSDSRIREIQPLISAMQAISEERGGKSLAQIAINWCICKGTVSPCPGDG